MSKKSQPSIMIGNMAGSYYALPMASEAQKAGLLALMPPNASKTIEEEASECDIRPCTHLPDKVRLSHCWCGKVGPPNFENIPVCSLKRDETLLRGLAKP